MINIDYLVGELINNCGGEGFLDRLHSEVQDAIIDAAEMVTGNDVLIKLLGLYALAQAINWVKTGKTMGEATDALSDEYMRVIQCLTNSLRGLGGECVVSNEVLRGALQYASSLINEVKARCLGASS